MNTTSMKGFNCPYKEITCQEGFCSECALAPSGQIKTAKELGRKGFSKYTLNRCPDCGTFRWVILRDNKPAFTRCRMCSNKHRQGKNHSSWKGGQSITRDRYIEIWVAPDSPYSPMARHGRYVTEHRLVMAKHLGRCLKSIEVVHHLNGNRQDNRLENLILVNKKNHPRQTLLHALHKRIRDLEQLPLPL